MNERKHRDTNTIRRPFNADGDVDEEELEVDFM